MAYRQGCEIDHLSLFSGIGGIDLAAHLAGFRTVGFCESNPYRQAVLRKHFPGIPIAPDVRKLDGTAFRGITGVFGGAPCQDASQANHHAKGSTGERTGLIAELVRIGAESGASYLVVENSPRVWTTFREDTRAMFERRGYFADCITVPAPTFHERKRAFIVAYPYALGGREGVQTIFELVHHELRQCSMAQPQGVEFILRDDADPVFSFEDAGRSMVAPVFCRTYDGVPYRVDRCRALGDTCHPKHIYPVLKAIADFETGFRNPQECGT